MYLGEVKKAALAPSSLPSLRCPRRRPLTPTTGAAGRASCGCTGPKTGLSVSIDHRFGLMTLRIKSQKVSLRKKSWVQHQEQVRRRKTKGLGSNFWTCWILLIFTAEPTTSKIYRLIWRRLMIYEALNCIV